MVTAFTLWLEAHYNKDYMFMYVGTVLIDMAGISATSSVLIKLV